MAFRRVQLPPGVAGQLWLTSMPGRFEPLAEFDAQLQRCGVGTVVCLTPRDEAAELSPQYHATVASGSVNYRWLNLPMRNFGVPDDVHGFRREIVQLAEALRRGDSVVLHCAAGMGRTGSAAACILKALGLPSSDALQRVRQAGSNPQNAAQSGFVDWF